ncbi:tRNA lysidine(34) synthetase TilS [bacterium]|nr:MAG: tRNA lysidine(34) synthetase TilS [bacterium]
MLRKHSSDPVLTGISESGLIRPGDRVLVAVSGGPDSCALLVAAHELGCDVIVAHYDHALRAGSELVADQVRALCVRLGVDVVSERRSEAMPRGSIQAGARALRYAFLSRARSQTRADVVALAHTADDLVEGAVMHLMRGCGLAGLRGMPSRRGAFVRPLLLVWRREVVDFLRRREIVAYEDPSNADTRFARVRVRREILPALERDRPGIGRRFFAAAMQAAATQESVAAQALNALQTGVASKSDLARMPEPVAAEVMKLLYTRAGGTEPSLSRAHLDSMLNLARPGRGGRGVDLPGGLRFRIVGDRMEVVASPPKRPVENGARPRLEVVRCRGCDDPAATHLRPELELRVGFRRPGLRMRPFGGRGSRKLQDIFVDARIPREERDAWPLVFAGDRLAWVPGVAVDSELMSPPGQAAVHVGITPMPVRWRPKVARLETPISPRGEPS